MPLLWVLGAGWFLQTLVGLVFECEADIQATRSITDRDVLEETEKCLRRMNSQAIKRLIFPFGWVQYILSAILLDPHPPLVMRSLLLRRRLRNLRDLKKS